MVFSKLSFDHTMFCFFMVTLIISQACSAHKHHHNHYLTSSLSIHASKGRPIPPLFFGIFFEEINHAGTGGLWAELVNNRGFEVGGRFTPSSINPWGAIGDENAISIRTELSSCFQNNPVALRMDVHCDQTTCPPGGVGIYNPGYWGINVEEGNSYKVEFYIKSSGPLEGVISLVSDDGTQVFAFQRIVAEAKKVKNWTKMKMTLLATGSYTKCRLQFTTTQKGTLWLDQISAMPTNTYKGHGFRTDLMEMLLKLKPKFLRFPGGCYVQGNYIDISFRWKETVGPWENRPGHLGFWGYWSDDGLGYFEYLQLAEDLGAEPVWVVNNGIGVKEQVTTYLIAPFVQEMLDSIEFARGSPNSTWGSLRAKMGHVEPFSLKYVAIGNEGCGTTNYKGNYLRFYKALRKEYPDIKIISNCDATVKSLDHPADLYDFHRYTNAKAMLQLTSVFEKIRRDELPQAPKAFVSEYAVITPKEKLVNGTFEGALAEAAFLLSLEQNSDVVEMVSYAPLFVNEHDQGWTPDAIYFNSKEVYGIASYWVQTFFKQSSGASLLNVHFHNYSKPENTYITAISWIDKHEKKNYITIKVVNFNNVPSNLKISIDGVDSNSMKLWRKTVLASDDLQATNTFDSPTKVVPVSSLLESEVGTDIDVVVQPYSFTAFDLINTNEQRQSPSKFQFPKKRPSKTP